MSHEATLLHELPWVAAERTPRAIALHDDGAAIPYEALADDIRRFAAALSTLAVQRGERIAIYLDKRRETVIASFGAPAHGATFVPVNPLLKPDQVAYILRDCGVRVLVTSAERLDALAGGLAGCNALKHVIVIDRSKAGFEGGAPVHLWADALGAGKGASHRVIDTDMAAILYTSGSTGKPKGVVLSHRNMVAGAKSVASYLGNHGEDILVAATPEENLAAIKTVLASSDVRHRLAHAARARVLSHHTWANSMAQLDRVLAEAGRAHRARAAVGQPQVSPNR